MCCYISVNSRLLCNAQSAHYGDTALAPASDGTCPVLFYARVFCIPHNFFPILRIFTLKGGKKLFECKSDWQIDCNASHLLCFFRYNAHILPLNLNPLVKNVKANLCQAVSIFLFNQNIFFFHQLICRL